MNNTEKKAMEAAIKFHETYERLAPQFGYETRPDTKAFDAESPNGKLMIAVCGEVLTDYAAATANNGGLREALEQIHDLIGVLDCRSYTRKRIVDDYVRYRQQIKTIASEALSTPPTAEGKWIAVSDGLPTVEGFYWFRSRDNEIGTWKCWWSLADPQAPAWSKNQLAWWSVPIIEPKAPEYTPHGQEASE